MLSQVLCFPAFRIGRGNEERNEVEAGVFWTADFNSLWTPVSLTGTRKKLRYPLQLQNTRY
jgi:hypothetical protein